MTKLKLKKDFKQSLLEIGEILTGSVAVVILGLVKGPQMGTLAKVAAFGVALRVLVDITKLGKKVFVEQE